MRRPQKCSNFAPREDPVTKKMTQKTNTKAIDDAIDYAISKSEFGCGYIGDIYRRVARYEIRPEKIREYIARLQADKKVTTQIVGSDLFILKPNTNQLNA